MHMHMWYVWVLIRSASTCACIQTVRHATPLDGPVLRRFRDLASRLGIWLSLGGFQETCEDASRLYNTHIVLDGSGQIVAKYRKIHLFDVEVQDGPILMESRSTKPGSEVSMLSVVQCLPHCHQTAQLARNPVCNAGGTL